VEIPFNTFLLVATVVVLAVALLVLAKTVARGEGLVAGARKMWSVIWKNTP
jgi:hypothetical protein